MQSRLEAAHKLLHFLEDNNYPAVICGGYARDTICEKPIRDVDLYVSRSHFHGASKLLFGPGVECTTYEPEQMEYMHQSITFQFEATLLSDYAEFGLETPLVNLVGVNDSTDVTVEYITSRYNMGICQAGISLDGPEIYGEFKSDFIDKQITLLRSDWGHEASMKQFIKLQAKYPWPMRIKPTEKFDFEI